MQPYKNLGGVSGVARYKIEENSITVEFKSGAERNYLYNEIQPGLHHVKKLKELAIDGRGLNSYIGKEVKRAYARKW